MTIEQKEAKKRYMIAYRVANKSKLKESGKRYRETNKSKIIAYRETNKGYNQEYYLKNKVEINRRNKEYREANKEKITAINKAYRETQDTDVVRDYNKNYQKANKASIQIRRKAYCQANKNKILEKRKQRELTDPLFKLRVSMAKSILKAFRERGFEKESHTKTILGCSYQDFKIYLESKFETWMTWENRGKYNGELNYGWDIDHIIPLSTAKTTEDIIKLNHYSNLQPLCGYTNRHIKRG